MSRPVRPVYPVRKPSLSSRFTRRLHAGTERALAFVERKPRVLSSALMVSLATFGATAFGTAPVTTSEPLPPHRLVVESLTLPELARQRDEFDRHRAFWYRTTETRAADTLGSLFARLGLLDAAALEFAARDANAKRLLEGRPGKRVRVRADEQARLVELQANLPAREPGLGATHFTRLTLRAGPEGLQSRSETVPFEKGTRMAGAVIHATLFAATDAADLPDSVAMQLADIFGSDIDFRRDLRRGDSFRVVYETPTADGEPATWTDGGGRILAAEFVNKGRKYEALWYQNESGRGQYYDFRGNSRRGTFLASPLEFTRITSGFGTRVHPILKSRRDHQGIDYAAPTGTPVRTVGDGVVEFAGEQRGYGNVVIVKHSGNRSTLYAHLSRIDAHAGQKLNQGDRLGAVGSTGMSTGPHLHFEFKVAGDQQDPATVARAVEAVALSARDKQGFASASQAYAHQLLVAATMTEGPARVD